MQAEWDLDDGYLNVKFWVPPMSLDEKCLAQLRNLRRLPFAVRHLSVMPDAHCGYGMPIGAIMATEDVVVPNAVGVDVGCGMIAVRLTGVNVESLRDNIQNVQALIKQAVPVGRNWHKECCDDDDMPDMAKGSVIVNQYDHARKQLGSLGGGNHFIELQSDQHGDIWIMIHSGSRNLGYRVAKYYNDWAKQDNEKNFSQVLPASDLAFFHRSHEGFVEYMKEMKYCVAFAKQNRAKMMLSILHAFRSIWGNTFVTSHVDIVHNQATLENHLGKNVIVHRKGAAGPYFGEQARGIIPGSMGTSSYIVSHTGEPMSYLSTSHGAGRPMSRTQAKKELDLEAQVKILDDLGVTHDMRSVKALDEAPGAYKDIKMVMALQSDLCNIEYTLTPILSIKG